MRNKLIKKLKELEIVRKQKVKLKNAGFSDFYIDVKKAYGDPSVIKLLARAIGEKLNKSITCIAAGGYGGLPLATAIASKNNLKLTLVREKPKTHGRNARIDGYIPTPEDKVVIIDDVFSTGGSLNQMMKVLDRTKTKIIGCYVVVKRGRGKLRVPLRYILESKDLL